MMMMNRYLLSALGYNPLKRRNKKIHR